MRPRLCIFFYGAVELVAGGVEGADTAQRNIEELELGVDRFGTWCMASEPQSRCELICPNKGCR